LRQSLPGTATHDHVQLVSKCQRSGWLGDEGLVGRISTVLEPLCTTVTREDGKSFIVQASERMEERLREVLEA
jgi:hypothetical protein